MGRPAFGVLLRTLRRERGTSQLSLATRVGSTPRHLSFVETGRSRPGRDLVLRIGEALDLPLRTRNQLLEAAGWPPAFPAERFEPGADGPVHGAIRRILDRHDPYPGSAVDAAGAVRMSNAAFRRCLPGVDGLSAEASVDRLFGDAGRAWLVNWEEVARAQLAQRRRDAARSGDPELHRLAERAAARMQDVAPPAEPPDAGPLLVARVRAGEDIVSTFTTVLRFETAREVGLSELRVELIFPADDASDAWFRR